MSGFELHEERGTIVAVGSFNPAIIQPGWLASRGILSNAEALAAQATLVPDIDVSKVVTPKWEFQTLSNRLMIQTADPGLFPQLPGVFGAVMELLEHTPVTAIGLNRTSHYKAASMAAWHGVGDQLVPKERWQMLEEVGMHSATLEGRRPDSPAEYLRMTVAPSAVVVPGVAFSFNEHYENEGDHALTAVDLCNEQWDAALSFFRDLEPKVLDAPPRSN